MADSQTIYLKMMVADYINARNDEAELNQRLEKIKSALDFARDSSNTFRKMLRLKNIDPDNIPPHLLPDTIQAGDDETPQTDSTSEESEPESQTSLLQKLFELTGNNGHQQSSEFPQPLNATHAFFLVFRNLNNPWLTQDEILQNALKFNYPLTKEDVTKIVWRQVPRKMLDRDGDKFRLTEKGISFEGFRRAPERHQAV